jgi:CBS domain-containing protein
MKIKHVCSRTVAVTERGATVRDAARLMREHHVGSLVVVEKREGITRPVGLLTDRDIVVSVVAVGGVPPEALRVEDVMSAHLATIDEDAGVFEAVEAMCERGVRRLPVVGSEGRLVGILALDDLLRMLSTELAGLAAVVQREGTREVHERVALDDAA